MGKKEKITTVVVIGIYLIVFGWLLWSYRNDLWKLGQPYLDTARYQRMEKKYDGFVGMKAEKAAQILTKDDRYLILDGNTAEWGADTGVFLFPVTNSHSREECFIYGFELDKEHIILRPQKIGWSADEFFSLWEARRPGWLPD